MSFLDDKRTWSLLAAGAAAAAAVGTRSAMGAGWRRVRGDAPPENPASSDTSWRDALLWTAAMGLAAGLARLVAERGAAAGWKRLTGDEPPLEA